MTGFELLEHTSEIGFRATGKSLEAAFEEAGKALFEIMTDLDRLNLVETVDLHVKSESRDALLFDFIDELNYIAQADGLLLREFDLQIIETDNGYELTGIGSGQEIESGMRLQEVKAPTYSDMVIKQRDGEWQIEMFLDV